MTLQELLKKQRSSFYGKTFDQIADEVLAGKSENTKKRFGAALEHMKPVIESLPPINQVEIVVETMLFSLLETAKAIKPLAAGAGLDPDVRQFLKNL